MKNFNGTILDNSSISIDNRAFKYGDGLFDTLKVIHGRIQFLEEHYFRLMASMRILRMEIPMNFTMEFYENEIIKTLDYSVGIYRIRVTIYRAGAGLYTPKLNSINYFIESTPYLSQVYPTYEIDLFKDFYISSTFLSTVKTTNRICNVLASIFADENKIQNCVLINEKKQLVETFNGNLFIIKDGKISTPPLSEGCINGIIRKKLINFLQKNNQFEFNEEPLILTDLLNSSEVFMTNSLIGIQSVTNFRKKVYSTETTQYIKSKFEELI